MEKKMSSKVEFTDDGYWLTEAKMTTTKPNGDQLIVRFFQRDADCDEIGYCPETPCVSVIYRRKKEIEQPKKFLGITLSKPKNQDTYEDNYIAGGTLLKDKYDNVCKGQLDDFLCFYTRKHNANKVLQHVEPEYMHLYTQALEAMMVAGLENKLNETAQKREAHTKAWNAKQPNSPENIANNLTIINSFRAYR